MKHTKKEYKMALQNTKRKQCFGYLAYNECRCGNGVILEDVFGWKYKISKASGRNVWVNEKGIQVKGVQKEAGDLINYNSLFCEIAGMNDNEKLSFKEIAKNI